MQFPNSIVKKFSNFNSRKAESFRSDIFVWKVTSKYSGRRWISKKANLLVLLKTAEGRLLSSLEACSFSGCSQWSQEYFKDIYACNSYLVLGKLRLLRKPKNISQRDLVRSQWTFPDQFTRRLTISKALSTPSSNIGSGGSLYLKLPQQFSRQVYYYALVLHVRSLWFLMSTIPGLLIK